MKLIKQSVYFIGKDRWTEMTKFTRIDIEFRMMKYKYTQTKLSYTE